MNKIRQALYTLNNFDNDKIKKYEKDLKSKLATFRKLYEVDETLKPDQAKNVILTKYFESINKTDDGEDRLALNAKVYADSRAEFQRIFKVPLANYWQGVVMGFDIISFDEQIVQSKTKVLAEVVKEKYGEEGLNLIRKILAN